MIAEITRDLGLDRPLPTQFYDYMKGVVLHFNLGYSYYSDASVKSLIAERLPATVSLAAGAVVIWLASGLAVGIVSAVRRRTWLDRAAMGTALVFISAPGILARADRAVPVRLGHRQAQDLPRRRQLRRHQHATRGNGSPR